MKCRDRFCSNYQVKQIILGNWFTLNNFLLEKQNNTKLENNKHVANWDSIYHNYSREICVSEFGWLILEKYISYLIYIRCCCH